MYSCNEVRVLVSSGGHHRLSDLDNRSVFSHISGGWESKIKVLAMVASAAPLSLARM